MFDQRVVPDEKSLIIKTMKMHTQRDLNVCNKVVASHSDNFMTALNKFHV